jgi:hypothetical protein
MRGCWLGSCVRRSEVFTAPVTTLCPVVSSFFRHSAPTLQYKKLTAAAPRVLGHKMSMVPPGPVEEKGILPGSAFPPIPTE